MLLPALLLFLFSLFPNPLIPPVLADSCTVEGDASGRCIITTPCPPTYKCDYAGLTCAVGSSIDLGCLPPSDYCTVGGVDGVSTALGCVPSVPKEFAAWTVRLVMGIAGGVALMLLILGGVQFVSSSGDPDSLDEAKEKITAAVSGLMLILFSVLVLKTVGVDILDLPGFDTTGTGGVTFPGP